MGRKFIFESSTRKRKISQGALKRITHNTDFNGKKPHL